MKSEFRHKLARESFEEKIGKVGELIQLSRSVKSQARREDTENERFNGAELSESVLGRDWNSPEEDAAWSNL
ncbi:MAG TPA: hypothetical protein VJ420_07565 [Candidatus Udaeobacter sp.]|nr:hypothetical protein [Candidatus Udaeobacter sp.]